MMKEIAEEFVALISNLFGRFSELNKGATELSHMQNHVMEFMYMQQRAMNLKEISKGLNVAKQQLTIIIRNLEARGYLTKMPDPKDKRAVLVSLTPKGKEVIEKKWTYIYERFLEKFIRLDEEEQLDFHFALHKLNVLLKKMEDEA
jgi:DNA-binding MarR family transcriptional regulator